jgi:hypothetical protein
VSAIAPQSCADHVCLSQIASSMSKRRLVESCYGKHDVNRLALAQEVSAAGAEVRVTHLREIGSSAYMIDRGVVPADCAMVLHPSAGGTTWRSAMTHMTTGRLLNRTRRPPSLSSGRVETPRTATAPCEIRLQTTVHHGAARTSGASHSMVVPVCSKSPAVVFLPYSARKPRRCTASESFGRVVDFTSIGSR